MKVSDFAIKSIIDVLTRDTRLMVGGDVTRAEGLSAFQELRARRANDLAPEQVPCIIHALSICTAKRDEALSVDRPEYDRILEALKAVLAAHGAVS
jgi:hypothetical protein